MKESKITNEPECGTWSYDPETERLCWSDELFRLLGHNPQSFVPEVRDFPDFFSANPGGPDARAAIRSVFSGKESLHIKCLACKADERTIDVEVTVQYTGGGGTSILVGTVRAVEPATVSAKSGDVSLLKRRENYLRLMENVIKTVKDAVAIARVEPAGGPVPKIVFVNEAFSQMMGFASGEVEGTELSFFQGPDMARNEEVEALYEALRKSESCEVTFLNYRKDGTTFWNNIALEPVVDHTGWHTHWVAVYRDVTFQKNREFEKQLLNDISLIFNQEESLLGCLDEMCRYLADFSDFSLAEIWLPSGEGDELHLIASHSSDTSGKEFYELSRNTRSFKIGEGLPGIIWQKNKPELWNGVGRKVEFQRSEAAAKAGLKDAFGMPLPDGGEMNGILVVGTAGDRGQLSFGVEILKKLDAFIGSEIGRKKLENELSQFFNSVDDLICIAGFDGYFKKVNPAFTRVLGYSAEELCAVPFLEFLHPDDLKRTIEQLDELNQGNTAFHFENRYITKDGKIKWLSWTTTPMPDQGILNAVAKDVTERKDSERLTADVSAMTRMGSWEVDLNLDEVYWSPMTCEIHGVPHGFKPDLKDAISYYREDFRPLVQDAIRRCIETGEIYDFEAVLVREEGGERWVRSVGRAEHVDGRCVRIFGSFQDIHQRKETESRLKHMADNLPGVLFQYHLMPDGSDKLTYVSKGSENIWGLTPEECKADANRVWKQIEAGGSLEKVRTSVIESARNLDKWQVKMRNVRPDGKVVWLEGNGIPRKTVDGTVVWDCFVIDITEKTELEALLSNTNRLAKIGSWEVNVEDHTVFWSEVAKEIHETDQPDPPSLSEGIAFYKEGDSRDRISAAIDRALKAEDEGFDEEVRLVTAKGNEIWVNVIGRVKKIHGKPLKIYGSIQDITTRKELEIRLLRTSENLPGVIFQYVRRPDGQDETRNMSQKSMDFWCLTPEQAMAGDGKVWKQIELGGDIGLLKDAIDASARSLEPWNVQWRSLRPDGEMKHHEGFGSPYKTADGTLMWDVLVMDVTEKFELAARLKRTGEIAKVGAWELELIDGKERSVYWSPLTRRILHVDQHFHPTLEKGLDFYVPESKVRLKTAIETLISQGVHFDLELLLNTAEGQEKWVRCIGEAEFVNGECIKAFGSFQDIHQSKISELHLKAGLKSLEDYKFAIDQSAIVAITDTKGVILSVNDYFCELSKFDREELIGKTHRMINSGHHPKAFFADLWKTISSGKVWRGEIKNRAKDGSLYWVDSTIVPFLDDDGKPFQYLAIRFDMTDRKLAEQKIKEKNERFRKVTEATNDAIWDWDLKKNQLYWGDGFKTLFGCDFPKEVTLPEFRLSCIHPDDLHRVETELNRVIDHPESGHFYCEYRFRKDDESYAFVVDRGVVIRDGVGKAIRMVGALTDITYRKVHEESLEKLNAELARRARELEASNQELEQFAYVASHDLQEPLRMVTGFMEQLEKKYSDALDDKAKRYIYFASDGARRMKRIILDLLEFSRAGKFDENLNSIDLNTLISDYKELRRRKITESAAVIEYDNLPVIESVKAPLVQVIHNLLDNSLKYVAPGTSPHITISVSDCDGCWQFEFADNGIGIDSVYFDKIFILFQRLHDKDDYSGTGMGLAIAKKNVESLGGKIRVESEIGRGSQFVFTLPK